VNPETDMLPGANRQWFTTQSGVRVTSPEVSISWATVDAPLITLEDINRGRWPESIQIHSGTVFSYVMNNYWYTDTPAQQGGTFTFRYAMTSARATTEAESAAFATEQRSPLVAMRRYRMGWDPQLPETGTGFVEASPEGVSVLTMRAQAAERNSYLVRVQNTTSAPLPGKLRFSGASLKAAYSASVIGEPTGELESSNRIVSLPLEPYQIRTVLVKLKSKASME
jgi:hypothetical protein